jgi:RHS repeat-associated protein
MSRNYDRAGHVTSETYPSGRTVSYAYDAAGRTNSFSGNLGGGTSRTYASGLSYSPFGGLAREQFGTDTAVYHNLHYNMRGQLYDVRVSANSVDDWAGELGALVNYYSTQWAVGGSGHDNNGNVLMSQTFIGSSYMEDRYSYDTLNRLTSVAEFQNGATNTGAQSYLYDRYGNRTINTSVSWGTGTNKDFTVNTANNRLGVPGGQSGTMSYDNAGNLTTDTYTGAGNRTYDAENRMTSAGTAGVSPASYSYDADGRRVRRVVNGTETWQVYGTDGELLAEYGPNGAVGSPQKEYGYRNGQLLVTVAAGGWDPPPSFTPPVTLVSGLEIKLEHLTELRSAVNQLRSHAGLSPFNFTVDPNPERYVTTVKADHILQLRTALEQARSALGLSTGGYEHPGLHPTDTIYAIDFQELRNQVLSAWNSASGVLDLRWLVTDHLGTPRMVIDKSGTLNGVSRHDYLPFGEELFAGTGGRTAPLGYTNSDGARQKFTEKERDIETGLDYFGARYYGSMPGRFTNPDDFLNDTHPSDPQSWNLYTYVRNNPVRYIDPNGTIRKDKDGNIIFKKTESTNVIFAEGQLRTQDGKTYTFSISWKADKGYVRADDGTKVEAFKATGEITVTIQDGEGNAVASGGKELVGQIFGENGSNYSNVADCHGTTFAKGQVWINNDQVEKIVAGDHYARTSTPQTGDVGIYTTDGNLKNTNHSVLVNTVNSRTGGVVDVTSKGGITAKVIATPGPGQGSAWQDPNAKLQYFTQRTNQPRR